MRTLIFVFGLLLSCVSLAVDELSLENGWVRAAPPSAKNLAGYGVLRNNRSTPVSIVALSSPFFEKVEAHKTSFSSGMMKMQQLQQLQLKANEVLSFEPGGMHFMLIKPKRAIVEGLKIPLTLKSESGEEYAFELVVRK